MNSRVKVFISGLVVLVGLSMAYASANGGTIIFVGAITEKTCTVNTKSNKLSYSCFRGGKERTGTLDISRALSVKPVKLAANVHAECIDSVGTTCTSSIILTNYT